MFHVASVFTPCCVLLDVVAQSLKLDKLFLSDVFVAAAVVVA